MPRIAAAVGVLVLIVFSIGFNTVQYPRVWEMVGATSHLPQSAEPSQPPSIAQPARNSATEVAVKPMIVWQATPVPLATEPDGGQIHDTVGRIDNPSHEKSPNGQAFAGPQRSDTPEHVRVASVRQDSTSDSPDSDTAVTPLVPIERPADEPDVTARSGWDPEVRRLPPVDDDASATKRPNGKLPENATPFYPSSGTD